MMMTAVDGMSTTRRMPGLRSSCLLLVLLLAGCGAGRQEYSKQPVVKVSPVEQVRGWLEGIAQTGEMDSGLEWAKEKLQSLDVPNKDRLIQEMNKLLTLRDRRQVSAKAKDMLKLLPPKVSQPS
jgi:PBP1b-binding outer membrane lipoprotein LpoB